MPFTAIATTNGTRSLLAIAQARALPLSTRGPRRRDLRSERGQTMVELTLIAPILFIILFAIIQFGIVYNNYITLTDAARVGARKAAVSRVTMNPEMLAEASVRAAAADLKQGDLNVFVTETAWAPGADVTVEAHYPYKINLLGIIVHEGELVSKTTERVE